MSNYQKIGEYITGELRWMNGVLEQRYEILEFLTKPMVERRYFEWRPVPTEKTATD